MHPTCCPTLPPHSHCSNTSMQLVDWRRPLGWSIQKTREQLYHRAPHLPRMDQSNFFTVSPWHSIPPYLTIYHPHYSATYTKLTNFLLIQMSRDDESWPNHSPFLQYTQGLLLTLQLITQHTCIFIVWGGRDTLRKHCGIHWPAHSLLNRGQGSKGTGERIWAEVGLNHTLGQTRILKTACNV